LIWGRGEGETSDRENGKKKALGLTKRNKGSLGKRSSLKILHKLKVGK